MSSEMYERMRSNPKFNELIKRRGRFAGTLSILTLVLFYGFVMVVAFLPSLLGKKVATGSMWTIGVVVELFIFIALWGLTAIYVRRANSEFDALTQDIIKDASKEQK
jgi:uncharacterized membrane protein (DUF485 family)